MASLGPVAGQQPPQPAGLVAPGNIDLSKRVHVPNADGSTSTLRSISINVDGKETVIPTLAPDGRQMTDEEAKQRFKETGEHLGQFSTGRTGQHRHSDDKGIHRVG